MTPEHDPERRRSLLTESDFARIEEGFERRMQRLCEVIGYDISTPQSREEIREDHRFVRVARKAKGSILAGIGASIVSALGMLFYFGGQVLLKAIGRGGS